MNLRSADLNLLVVLEALLEEAHVTRAAHRLNISQSAASNALERCRQTFNDRLLVRAGSGMRLTPRGQALRSELKQVLAGIASLIDPTPPELASLSCTVRVGMADALVAIAAAPVQRRLSQDAPGLRVAYLPWKGGQEMTRQLEDGGLDLVLSVTPSGPPGVRHIEVVQEHYQVALRRGHPALQAFDLDTWLRYPHVVVSFQGESHCTLDDALLTMGRRRHVAAVLPSFLCALPLAAQSDAIALLPSLSFTGQPDNIVRLQPPIAVDGFPLHLAWHARHDADVAVQYIARALRESVAAAWSAVNPQRPAAIAA